MLIVLAVCVVLANVHQPYPSVAPLQHIPTLIAILVAPLLLRRYPLTNGSVAAIVCFLLLHTLAGRYTYSNVPYDAWARALTGHDLSEPLHLARNDFDRVVHFSFGLLCIRPVSEAARRHTGVGTNAGLWMAWFFVGAVSAAYEIVEWLLTMIVAPDMAADYNGQQGDPWDSQKDMAMAIVGASLSAIWAWRRRPRDGRH